MNSPTWVVVAVAVLFGAAWYLSYSAARLDRLHSRVEAAVFAVEHRAAASAG